MVSCATVTPEMVVVLWVGFDEPRSLGQAAARIAVPIWARFLKEATGGEVAGMCGIQWTSFLAQGATWMEQKKVRILTQIGGPDGISCSFQVSTNSGEPFASILARNLFSKHRCRPALGDKAVKSGPEVSLVGMAFPLSRARKRLTWA